MRFRQPLGFDWLDLRLTANMSAEDWGTSAFRDAGFRHATKAQVQQLFELLGPLATSVEGVATAGITRTTMDGKDLDPETSVLGEPVTLQVGRVEYRDLRSAGGGLVGEAHFAGPHVLHNQRDPRVGSFLVRRAADCQAAGQSDTLNCNVPANAR